MKRIITCLAGCLFLLSNCAPEAKQGMVNEKGVVIENRGPIYITSSCQSKSTKEDVRKCGDRVLAVELKEAAMKAVDPKDPPKLKKLVVSFVVTETGKVDQVKVSRRVGKGVDEAVVRFVGKTKWEAAIHDGAERRIIKQIPIILD